MSGAYEGFIENVEEIEKKVKELEKENEDLKRSRSRSIKGPIMIKNIKKGPQLNIANISLKSQSSKGKIRNSSLKSGKGIVLKKKFIKNPINIGNFSVIEQKDSSMMKPAEDSQLDISLNKIRADLDALKIGKDSIKRQLIEYRDKYELEHNGERPNKDTDPFVSSKLKRLEEYSQQIDQKQKELRSLEDASLKQLKSRSVSPGINVCSFIRRSKFYIRVDLIPQ